MLERGAFAGVHAAMMVHPVPAREEIVRTDGIIASSHLQAAYTGRAAHAAAYPWLGLNAADALTVAQVAIGLLRQHFEPGDRVHGVVTLGGGAPNVIPERTAGSFIVRSKTLERLERLAWTCIDAATGVSGTGCCGGRAQPLTRTEQGGWPHRRRRASIPVDRSHRIDTGTVDDMAVRVLIVDDQEPFRMAARMVVELTEGFEVVGEAETGEDSVEMARDRDPDLVLMDVNLPGIDGLEATRRILAGGDDRVVVLLLSTYEEAEYAPRAAECGAAAYIPKSVFGPERLEAAWEEAKAS
jgi:CheY-like chemotaxis protein